MKQEMYFLYRKIKALGTSLLFYICRIFPIQKHRISVCTFEGKGGFGCNPKYVVQALHQKHPEYQFIWFVNDMQKQFPPYIKKVKNKTSKLCFYAFLNDYNLLEIEYMQKGIDEFINNQFIENNVFSISKFIKKNKNFYTLDIQSLTYLKDYLLKQKNNKYILNDSVDIEILKEIALSNNELILVDEGNINNIHKKLANRIIKEEDLKKESF